MRTRSARPPDRRARGRSRFGYDHRWWGEPPRAAATDPSYWEATRRPLPSLLFILPILAAYELGVAWLASTPLGEVRTGADTWVRQALAAVGLTDRWLPPLALILALLGWQAAERRDWRFRPGCLPGMLLESLALAVALVGLSKLVDLGFAHLERSPPTAGLTPESARAVATVFGFLGAGVYEEALFRLALIPLLHGILRTLQAPSVLANTLAITASAFLFSLAHHAGAPGEVFTWYAFIFRWVAGVFFAWVFVVRGFGVAVGTHAAYDILVGWLGWHF